MKEKLKKFKKLKKTNIKAFTLIEMLGVIVIIGIILIVVFPTLSQMIHDNENQELSNYYDLVDEASQVYAAKLTDKLGSSKYIGCAEVTLNELINAGYIQKFNDKNITCKTGSGNIKIRNNKGIITVNFQLNCSEGGKDVYITGKNDNGACQAYVMESQNNLKTTIEENESLTKVNVNNEVYITGISPNNYIWYSGKLWQVVSYNALTEVTKAVTVNPVTSIYYNSSSTNGSLYSGSDAETWLNNEFLNSLKDSQNFLVNSNWNATPNTSIIDNPTSTDKIEKAKIGLLTTFDYGKVQQWYAKTESWLLSEGTGGNSLYSSTSGIQTTSSKTILGVRPVVTFNSDVNVYSGAGTINNPYIIDNSQNAVGKSGEYINTRFSGEYIKIGDNKYRIISNNGGILKVIGMQKVGNYVFSDINYDYSTSTLKNMLEETLTNEIAISENGEFCTDTINSASAVYQSSKCLTPSRVNNNIRIGLPKIGDLFTTTIPGMTEEYWTLNPNTEADGDGNSANATINLITANGKGSTAAISTPKATVIVIYVNSSAKIVSGIGTSSNPYVIEL